MEATTLLLADAESSADDDGPGLPATVRRHRWCRIAAVVITVLGTLAFATPAFAWPMCGC